MSATVGGNETAGDRQRVLFVDNFDSFTYNLVEYVSEHAETEVLRNTAALEAVRAVDPDAIVVSPGRATRPTTATWGSRWTSSPN
jgi:anthranilate synthase component 2